MHILQLCPRVPYPLHTGGAIAMYDVPAGLVRAGHRVTMLAINTPKHHQPADSLEHLGPNFRLVTVDVNTNISASKALKNLLLSRQPYNVERFISAEFGEKLLEILRTEEVDVVQMEGTFVAWYAEFLNRQHRANFRVPPLVLRAHNVEYTIWQMLAKRELNPLKRFFLGTMAARLENFERRHLTQFDAVAAITDDDAQRLRALGCPEPVLFIPAGVELTRFVPDPAIAVKPRTLFMIGSLNWMPNLEGLEWLLREVWPTFHAEVPDVELHVAGSGTPTSLRAPRTDNVIVHGFVESASAFMQQYELMLVPLLSGGGMRIKIIEGMALGKPVLSTPLGAEGIAVRDGHDLLLRDSATAWLEALRAWARGELPTAAIGAAAAHTAADLYDNRRVTQRFVDLYERLQPVEA
ncbi:glycosyltransferase family 4 protein [Hymenobacter sp. BT770]|uniref:glycosyltransferase family 4 protein n=1 Tax=Hymenobacter sp. BT770 TaxID=2886942 RepID=UPI001D10C96A|nr:glycosyltransferase family 4 protein [Hymenobacter sp. BT770]MCC3153055.1 glycosyltransferase family 4 protein [Hymenobacter sp. BT770]MDO3415032.1 glycosyltransferase family 4 protein [Hymenobacter sp. BT770]